MIGTLRNGKDMGRHLIPPLGTVDTDSPHGVDGEPLVGVDGNTEEAGVGVDQSLHVSHLQVEQHRGVIEVGQVGHVLTAVVLGRVDLGNQLLLEGVGLALPGALDDLDLDLGASSLLNHSLAKLLLRVRDVAGPLGVIRLLSNPLLDLIADKEVGSWVGVIPSLEFDLSSGHLDFYTDLPSRKYSITFYRKDVYSIVDI